MKDVEVVSLLSVSFSPYNVPFISQGIVVDINSSVVNVVVIVVSDLRSSFKDSTISSRFNRSETCQ